MRQEVSQMLAKVFEALRGEGIGKSDIAAELCLLVEDLNNLTVGLTLSGVSTAVVNLDGASPKPTNPSLRLVK